MGVHQAAVTFLLMWAVFLFLIAEHVIPDPILYTFFGVHLTLSQVLSLYSLMMALIAFRRG